MTADYPHQSRDPHSTSYLWPTVWRTIEPIGASRVFELGCGNGNTASRLCQAGMSVTAIDTSRSGVEIARARCPAARIEVASAYDDLAQRFGQFPIVVSLEVVEHLIDPRTFARRVYDLLEPGGVAIVSTPYHGYFKNLALAITGKMDSHFTALWDGGHIKFWSERTLRRLLMEGGFQNVAFRRVGRIPLLAKSMIAITRKP